LPSGSGSSKFGFTTTLFLLYSTSTQLTLALCIGLTTESGVVLTKTLFGNDVVVIFKEAVSSIMATEYQIKWRLYSRHAASASTTVSVLVMLLSTVTSVYGKGMLGGYEEERHV
jgi:hypothetical protein